MLKDVWYMESNYWIYSDDSLFVSVSSFAALERGLLIAANLWIYEDRNTVIREMRCEEIMGKMREIDRRNLSRKDGNGSLKVFDVAMSIGDPSAISPLLSHALRRSSALLPRYSALPRKALLTLLQLHFSIFLHSSLQFIHTSARECEFLESRSETCLQHSVIINEK